MTRTARTLDALRATALIAAVALVLAGCSAFEDLFGDDKPERGENGQVSEVVEGASVFDIQDGDCLSQFATEGDVQEIDIIPCDQEHHQEVLMITQITAEQLPDEEAVKKLVREECVPAFKDFVGTSFDDSSLDIQYLSPSQESWENQDDRDIVCTVYDPAGATTGTLKDANR